MSQDHSKLCHSIDQYQQTADELEAELVKAFISSAKAERLESRLGNR
jgi:hypothetical protein